MNIAIIGEDMSETVSLSSLTLQEKIGQLIIVKPEGLNEKYIKELYIGGIFLKTKKSAERYMEIISFYQNNSKIKLFVAADMEDRKSVV